MSNGDDDTIIICGGAGKCKGEISLTIYDHTAVNVAVAVFPEGLQAALEIGGMSDKKAHRCAARYVRRITRFYEDLYDDLSADGVPVHEYEPHQQNLPDD